MLGLAQVYQALFCRVDYRNTSRVWMLKIDPRGVVSDVHYVSGAKDDMRPQLPTAPILPPAAPASHFPDIALIRFLSC